MDAILNTTFSFILTDDSGETKEIVAGFDKNEYIETHETNPGNGVTTQVEIAAMTGSHLMTINGDAWRDIENGEYLEEFIRDVLIEERDADEFFSNIAEALEVNGEPGQVIS